MCNSHFPEFRNFFNSSKRFLQVSQRFRFSKKASLCLISPSLRLYCFFCSFFHPFLLFWSEQHRDTSHPERAERLLHAAQTQMSKETANRVSWPAGTCPAPVLLLQGPLMSKRASGWVGASRHYGPKRETRECAIRRRRRAKCAKNKDIFIRYSLGTVRARRAQLADGQLYYRYAPHFYIFWEGGNEEDMGWFVGLWG